VFCDRNCNNCQLQLHMDTAQEPEIIGIEKLLSDQDQTIALIPEGNKRIKRRRKGVL
ncbi:lysine 2,3-aminomutase, partial [bacterium]|nr:lysine 2,3-aminomutase [bacterium]